MVQNLFRNLGGVGNTGQIANFTARLTADTRGFTDPVRQARGDLEGLGGSVRSTGALLAQGGVFAAGILAAGAATFQFANNIATAGDEIAKASRQIDFSVEGYQRWSEVLRDAGTNIDGIRRGLGTLSSAIDGAGRGIETYTNYFRTLNTELRDTNGELRTQEAIFRDLFRNAAEGGVTGDERIALGRLFGGRAGQAIAGAASTLGSAAAVDAELARANVFFDEESAAQAEVFRDAIADLRDEFTQLSVTVGTALIPSVTSFVETLSGGIAVLNQTNSGLFPTIDPASFPGFIQTGAGGGAQAIYNRDGSITFPQRAAGATGGGIYGRSATFYDPGNIDTFANRLQQDPARQTADAIREGSQLQFNANQILDQVNANLEVIPWDQMIEEIAGERQEAAQNWTQGLQLLSAMVNLQGEQIRATVDPQGYSPSTGGFAQPLGARTSTRRAAGIGIFRDVDIESEADRVGRNLNFLRFSALAGREDATGRVQGFGIDASEQAGIIAERNRLLAQGYDIRQDPTGFIVSGERGGGIGELTIVNNNIVDGEVVQTSIERRTGPLATRDDVYNVRTG